MLFNFLFNFIFAYIKYLYNSKPSTDSVQLHQNLSGLFLPPIHSFTYSFNRYSWRSLARLVWDPRLVWEQTRWQTLLTPTEFASWCVWRNNSLDNLWTSPLYLLFLFPFVSLLFSRDSAKSRSCKWSWVVKENFPQCSFLFSLNPYYITKLLNISEA